MKKYTIEKVSEIVSKRGYKLISLKYINAHSKIDIECPKHGVFSMRFYSFNNDKQNCPKCSRRSRKYTIEEVSSFIKEKNCKLLSTQYLRNSDLLNIKCPKHGIFKRSLDSFNSSKLGCPKCSRESCARKRKISYKYVKNEIEKAGYILHTKEYKNSKNNLTIECSKHGLFKIKWNDFQQKHGCSKCSFEETAKNQRNNIDDIRDWINNNTDYSLISKKYTNNKTKLKIECSKHGIFYMNWGHISNGHKCPKCQTTISRQHQEIVNFIKNNYKGDIIINDRDVLKGKELDIYIPKFNLGIEFDGLYWHSEKVKENTKKSNKEKAKLIKDNNINVLMVFEDEWNNPIKKELIKGMVKHRLGMFKKKLRASKLEIRKIIKNKEYKDFFEKYHLDGHTNGSFAYGLFDGETMVSCMSFRKSFSDKCWEIARFASKPDVKIHGNAGKMVKKFKEEYNEKLITYSNNRLSLGKTYKALGFKEITKTTDPSYYYTDFKTRLWRFKCKRINDPDIITKYPTEKAQAEGGVFSEKFLGHNKPLYKIYDYGHRKWEL